MLEIQASAFEFAPSTKSELSDQLEPSTKFVPGNFVKLTRIFEQHRGVQFQDGENVDPLPFDATQDCVPGGIYFCREDQIHFWLGLYCDGWWIRDVCVPPDARCVWLHRKFKASKVFLHPRQRLTDWLLERPEVLDAAAAYFGGVSRDQLINHFKKKDALLDFVQEREDALKYLALSDLSSNLIRHAVKHFRGAIQYVPDVCLMPDTWLDAVTGNGKELAFVPSQFITHKLCWAAVRQSPEALQFIPPRLLQPKYVYKALSLCKNDRERLQLAPLLPLNMLEPKLFAKLFAQPDFSALLALEPVFQTLCNESTSEDANRKIQTIRKVYHGAVAYCWDSIKFIPRQEKTAEMCRLALLQNYWLALPFVPWRFVFLMLWIGVYWEWIKVYVFTRVYASLCKKILWAWIQAQILRIRKGAGRGGLEKGKSAKRRKTVKSVYTQSSCSSSIRSGRLWAACSMFAFAIVIIFLFASSWAFL